MRSSNPLQKYYETEQERLRQFIREECRTDAQRAAVSVMTLERCAPQLALLAEQLPELDGLSLYAGILDDLERSVCDGAALPEKAIRGYEGWCLRTGKLAEGQHISPYSPWRLQLLPGFLEQLGAFFSQGPPLPWEDPRPALLGFWLLFWYETNHRFPSPGNFNFYQYIRSTHPEIEKLGRERDALREELEKSVAYGDAYDAISRRFKEECQKYWGEAAAEKKRLAETCQPMTVKRLLLAPKELDRLRADVWFATTEGASGERLRQRLREYRLLDITRG